MDAMIKTILDVDKKARELQNCALKKKENCEQEIKGQKEKLENEYNEKLAQAIENTKKQEKIFLKKKEEQIDTKTNNALNELENQFEQEFEQWVQNIVNEVVGDQ